MVHIIQSSTNPHEWFVFKTEAPMIVCRATHKPGMSLFIVDYNPQSIEGDELTAAFFQLQNAWEVHLEGMEE